MRVTPQTFAWAAVLLLGCGDSTSRPDRELDAAVDMPDGSAPDTGVDSAEPVDVGADRETADAAPDGCAVGLTECPDEGGSLRCVDLQSDTCHCGECGNQCDCSEGICVSCGRDTINCVPGVCGPGSRDECVDHLNNPDNCGGCDIACTEDEQCYGGSCVPNPR